MSKSADHYIAVDLGASNGRVVLGTLLDGRLALTEALRFDHYPIARNGWLVWDWERIKSGVREGLITAAGGRRIASVSCDGWAQDFGLLDETGTLMGPPVSYRDARTAGMPESFASIIAPDALARRAGSVAAPITTLCQLRALSLAEPLMLARAETLLHIADLVHHDLAGTRVTDRTLATASQLRNLGTGTWDDELLGMLGIPCHVLPEVVDEPCRIGEVTGASGLPRELRGTPVASSAGHDTAAAASFLPGADEGVAFLMSGTWSMLGVGLDRPRVPRRPGPGGTAVLGLPHGRWGTFRPLMGLWLIQECRRAWSEPGSPATHREVVDAAATAATDSLIDPEDARFAGPTDMPRAVQQFCAETGQRVPTGVGEIARVTFASMALNCRLALEELQRATGAQAGGLRVVGGGSANGLLCSLMADATRLPIIAGPVEATAAGNILLQAQAAGAVDGRDAIRAVAEASFATRRYEPSGAPDGEALDRFRALRARSGSGAERGREGD